MPGRYGCVRYVVSGREQDGQNERSLKWEEPIVVGQSHSAIANQHLRGSSLQAATQLIARSAFETSVGKSRCVANLHPNDVCARKNPASLRGFWSYGWLTGVEPATSGTTNQRSNQLSYSHQTDWSASLPTGWRMISVTLPRFKERHSQYHDFKRNACCRPEQLVQASGQFGMSVHGDFEQGRRHNDNSASDAVNAVPRAPPTGE